MNISGIKTYKNDKNQYVSIFGEKVFVRHIRTEENKPIGAIVSCNHNNNVYTGVSLCSPQEDYNKHIGFMIAYGRLNKRLHLLTKVRKISEVLLDKIQKEICIDRKILNELLITNSTVYPEKDYEFEDYYITINSILYDVDIEELIVKTQAALLMDVRKYYSNGN